GSERTAGMRGFKWSPSDARGADRDIRTWGQLGLTGEWAHHQIQTYGHAPSGTARFFQWKVLKNGDKWNPNFREYVESGRKMIADEDRAAGDPGSRPTGKGGRASYRHAKAWTASRQAAGADG